MNTILWHELEVKRESHLYYTEIPNLGKDAVHIRNTTVIQMACLPHSHPSPSPCVKRERDSCLDVTVAVLVSFRVN